MASPYSPARMVQIGWEEQGASLSPFQRKAGVRRATSRSLLSMSLSRSDSNPLSPSSSDMPHVDSFGDLSSLGEASGSPGSVEARCLEHEVEDALEGAQVATPAVKIPYTRVARARLDAAEQQGRAFDQRLELLAAVRAYFVDQQRAAAPAPADASPAQP